MTHNEAIDLYNNSDKYITYVNLHQLCIGSKTLAEQDSSKVKIYTEILQAHLDSAKRRAKQDPFNINKTWSSNEDEGMWIKDYYESKGLELIIIPLDLPEHGNYWYTRMICHGVNSFLAYKNLKQHVIPVVLADVHSNKEYGIGYKDNYIYKGGFLDDEGLRDTLFKQTSGKCYLCGNKITERSVEHINPKCRIDGINTTAYGINALIACRQCNSLKASSLYSDELKYSIELVANNQIEYSKSKYPRKFEFNYSPNYSTWFNLEKE